MQIRRCIYAHYQPEDQQIILHVHIKPECEVAYQTENCKIIMS